MTTAGRQYPLGSDPAELERLDHQGRMLGPATRMLFEAAGIGADRCRDRRGGCRGDAPPADERRARACRSRLCVPATRDGVGNENELTVVRTFRSAYRCHADQRNDQRRCRSANALPDVDLR